MIIESTEYFGYPVLHNMKYRLYYAYTISILAFHNDHSHFIMIQILKPIDRNAIYGISINRNAIYIYSFSINLL